MFKSLIDQNSKVFTAIAVSGMLFLTSCGKNGNPIANVVENVTLKSYKQNGDDWVQMTASLVTGNFILASVNVPIVDPKDPSKVYGQVALVPKLCNIGSTCQGGGDLSVSLDLTLATKAQSLDPVLPNGTMLPVGGLQNSQIIALPVSDTGGRVYFAFGPNIAMLGTALPFAQLDPAGQYVPGLNIFQPIQMGDINLIAGIFAGSAKNTTGVGVFADLSSVVNQTPVLAAGTSTQNRMLAMSNSPEFKSKLVLKAVRGSEKSESKFYKKMLKLHQKGAILKLE